MLAKRTRFGFLFTHSQGVHSSPARPLSCDDVTGIFWFLSQIEQQAGTQRTIRSIPSPRMSMATCCPLSSAFLIPRSLKLRILSKRSLITLSPLVAFSGFAQGLALSSLPKYVPPERREFAMGGLANNGNNWCSTASINPTSGSIDINHIAGYGDEDSPIETVCGRSFDITSNSGWMEYIENDEDRVDLEGGAGAYDVMRCDLEYCPSEDHHPMNPNWRVWGEDFHLCRLRMSFCSLLEHMTEADANNEEIDQALIISREIVRALLMEAHSSEVMQSLAPPQESEVHDVTIQLVKMTILWTPKPNGKDDVKGNQTIKVRGHACSSCMPVPIHKCPSSIVATIALPLYKSTGTKVDATNEPTLPSRLRSPEYKVASWCRLRRPLEDPGTYKPPGVGEVLMARSTSTSQSSNDAQYEILEGLTSNFFVIYKDGTLRTPEKGVLYGYVRHLVLACAQRAGLILDYSPILMDDASKGLWESAFITSSSRLIYPVSRILIPETSKDDSGRESSGVVFREFWANSHPIDGHNCTSSPRWLNLLNEVLREGGYERMTEEESVSPN